MSDLGEDKQYMFPHTVLFNEDQDLFECSCKMFTEVGILCSHYLRVMHMFCVQKIPYRYIMQRWCKGVKDGQSNDYASKVSKKESMLCSSVWRLQMTRKMNSLIVASQLNKQSMAHCEDYFNKLKQLVEMEVGSIYYEDDGQGKGLDSSKNVLNPPGSRKKGVRNNRLKSIVEKKSNQAKGKKRDKLSSNDSSASRLVSQVSFHLFLVSS